MTVATLIQELQAISKVYDPSTNVQIRYDTRILANINNVTIDILYPTKQDQEANTNGVYNIILDTI